MGTAIKNNREKFEFTEDWFKHHIPNWTRLFKSLSEEKIRVLEIGVWEGCSTTWILEELLHHPESILVAVDTFEGSPVTRVAEPYKHVVPKLEERFRSNVKLTGEMDKVTICRSTSFNCLTALHQKAADPFDLIYIDGSHATLDVLSDAVLAWPLLSIGGFMIFDDYGSDSKDDCYKPKLGIDAFLTCAKSGFEVVDVGYQVVIKKTSNGV